jgi:serine/threonine-protein kinase
VLVSSDLAHFLRIFTEPASVRCAVAAYSSARNIQPAEVLASAEPAILDLIRLGYLQETDSKSKSAEIPSLLKRWGDAVLVQDLDGGQVFRATSSAGDVAIKVGAARSTNWARSMIEREAEVLRQLGGGVFPRVIDCGSTDGRDYIVVEWFDGADALARTNSMRHRHPDDVGLICERVLKCYASLEGLGWLHGDVHPRNIIVDADGGVKLIDFAHARRTYGLGVHHVQRGGIVYFHDPQYAAALLAAGDATPEYTSHSEQYSLAALIYLLIAGQHYLSFKFERKQMLAQIVADDARSFASVGCAGQLAIEAVLRRAMQKSPEERFLSITEFQLAFTAALRDRPDVPRRAGSGRSLHTLAHQEGAPIPATMQEASLHDGAAGIAYAQYRLAMLTDSPVLLASSDVWIHHAIGHVRSRRNSVAHDGSLHHSAAGVHCVASLIAVAIGDNRLAADAANAFLQSIPRHARATDITHGSAGALLGCALLLEELPDSCETVRHAVAAKGNEIAERLGITNEGSSGIAHGLAGRLYALLRWSEARDAPIGAGIEAALDELTGLDDVDDESASWPSRAIHEPPAAFLRSSWCNGSAGFVHLLLLAERLTASAAYSKLAQRAADVTWRNPSGSACLCCGAAGGAYAMLAMYRASAEAHWLERARTLTQRAAMQKSRLPGSLFKGAAGIELLENELSVPHLARMPMFERSAAGGR